MNIIVNLKGAKTSNDVIMRFAEALKIAGLQGNSWDAFNDNFRNLDSDSKIISGTGKKVDKLHLTIKNSSDLVNSSEKDYSTLVQILSEATNVKNRGDGIKFTFELMDDEP